MEYFLIQAERQQGIPGGGFTIFAEWRQGISGGGFICKKRTAGILVLFLIISAILCPMGVDAAVRQDDSRFRIRITVGEQDFSAVLYDNETTRAWAEQMPMTLEMNELNGNEKYHYFSESLPTNQERPDAIHTGNLMLYGQSCLVLFYKDFVTSYSYTSLGYMEDAAGLANALGNGNVTVSFRLDDGERPDGKEELRKLYDEENAVTADGIVTGKKKGTATITAAATDGSGIKGRYKITVMPHAVKKISLSLPNGVKVSPKGVVLKCKTKSIVVGKKVKISVTVSATGKMANKKLAWSTSNKKYATVNANGGVTAKKAGKGKTVLITARATDGSGKKTSIRIRIKS